MPDVVGALRRLLTRDEGRPHANEARVLAILAEDGPDLTAHAVGVKAGFPPGRAYVVLARLYQDGRVVSRFADDRKRVVYRVAGEPTATITSSEGRHREDA